MISNAGNGDEHAELVFGDVPNARYSLLIKNQEYGTLSLKED